MTERYSGKNGVLRDHRNDDGTTNVSGVTVCVGNTGLIQTIAALLNEDILINGIVEMSMSQTADEFVDDVIRHTKVQS